MRDAVLAECVYTPTGTGQNGRIVTVHTVGEKAWRAIATRLGIKPEVES